MHSNAATRLKPSAFFFVIGTNVFVQTSAAQHSDVFISVDANRIVVQDSVHADSIRGFDVWGDGTVWHGSNPGYSTTGGNQFKVNDEVNFNVESPLLFSIGQSWDLARDDTYLRQFWPVFSDLSVTIDAKTGSQPGFLIGSIGHRGTLHQHHTFELASRSGHAPQEGAYAIQQVISASGYVRSDPFWIVLNNGLPIAEFAATLRSLPPIDTDGDYDRNGVLDVRDINRLREQVLIRAELCEFTNEFDLNGDTRIDLADLEFWVRDIRHSWIGDMDLDGTFSSTDLIHVFQFGHYEDQELANSRWEHGDWNADGEFNSGDLILAFQDGGYERGPRSVKARAVPEPLGSSEILFSLIVVAANNTVRRTRRHRMGTRISQLNRHSSRVALGLCVTITAVVVTGCARPTAFDDASAKATANGSSSGPQTRQYDAVSEQELARLVSTSDEPILVEFGVDFNCARCDQMTPVVNELRRQFAGQARIVRVGFYPSSAFQAGLALRICPTYVFYDGGRLVDRFDGPGLLPILQSKLSALVADGAGTTPAESVKLTQEEAVKLFP